MDIFFDSDQNSALHKCGRTPKDCFTHCFSMSHGNKKKDRKNNPWK